MNRNDYVSDFDGTTHVTAHPLLSLDSDPIEVDTNHKHIIPFSETFPLVISSHNFTQRLEIPENYHDYLEVSIVENGNGLLKVGHNSYPISDGDVMLMGPSVLHTVEVPDFATLSVTSVFFMPGLVFFPGEPDSNFDWLRPFYDQSAMRKPIIDSGHSNLLASHFRHLVDTQNEESQYRNLRTRINLLEVLLDVLKVLNVDDRESDRLSRNIQSNSDQLDRVLALMNKRYQDKINLTEAAEEACMSVQHFCRFFKNATGNTFTEHLTRIRVAHAKELLLQRNLRITDVAYEVGFGSQSYFFRAFRQVTGSSPREFVDKASSGIMEN